MSPLFTNPWRHVSSTNQSFTNPCVRSHIIKYVFSSIHVAHTNDTSHSRTNHVLDCLSTICRHWSSMSILHIRKTLFTSPWHFSSPNQSFTNPCVSSHVINMSDTHLSCLGCACEWRLIHEPIIREPMCWIAYQHYVRHPPFMEKIGLEISGSQDSPVFPAFFCGDGDSNYQRETLFKILGTPKEMCLICTGTPVKTCCKFWQS